MHIDITDVLKKQRDNVYIENKFFESEIVFDENMEIQVSSSLLLSGKFFVAGSRVILKGSVTGQLILRCSRCLEEFIQDIHVTIEEEFVKDRKEIRDDTNYFEGSSVDIIPIVKKSILLSLPIKNLCNADCKGLCQVCGNNMNVDNCDCKNNEYNPRLSILKNLLKDN